MDTEGLKPYLDTEVSPPLSETVESVYKTVVDIFESPRNRNNVTLLGDGRGFRIKFWNKVSNDVTSISMINYDNGRVIIYVDISQGGMSNFYIISSDGQCRRYYFDSDEDYKSGVSKRKQDRLGISSSVSNEDLLSLVDKLTMFLG